MPRQVRIEYPAAVYPATTAELPTQGRLAI
jgi:hypothetical protein